jgi:O-antigen ligase
MAENVTAVASAVGHRMRSARWGVELPRRREQWAAILTVLVLGAVAADSIPGAGKHVPKGLLLVLVLAGASILLTIATQQLFLGWLFLAPLFQESASHSRIGHLLALALYTAPPIAFALKARAAAGPRPRRQWFDVVPALYSAFLLASLFVTASGELRHGAVSTVRNFYQTILVGVIVYYVVAFWRGRPLSVTLISRLLLIAAALQGAMATVESLTGWNLWHDESWATGGEPRAIATLANPAVTGAFIGVGIVVALAVLCWHGPASLHRLAVVMLVVGLPGLYATKTRGPILATAIVAGLCLLSSRRSRLMGLGVSALIALTLLFFWPQIRASSVYTSRFDQRQNIEERLVLQEVSIKLAEKKPILGWGYDSFDRVKYDVPVPTTSIPLEEVLKTTSHDTFLTIVVEFGVVGLLLFVLPWAVILVRALRAARAPSSARWFLVAGVGSILVIGINGGTLDYRFFSFIPMIAWLFLGLLRRQLDSESAAPEPA